MTDSLKDKVALVTGGSRSIGAEVVRRLAAEGARVAFTYANSAQAAEKLVAELKAKGRTAKAYQADAGKTDKAAGLIREVVKDFGGIDILVNNAGVFEGLGPIGAQNQADYDKVMAVNVAGVFALTNEAVKVMKPGARVINISSCLGERAMPDASIYVASKFAVTGFSRAWAKDLAPKGILVNAVQPGPINTDMNPETGDFADHQKAQVPLGRYGQPAEVAGLVAFLAGPDATFITGATINVDGGWNA